MTSKPPVLLNRPVSYAGTMKKLDELFTVHKLWLADDKLGFAKKIAPEIRAAFSSGHDPFAPEILDALPNLKLVACGHVHQHRIFEKDGITHVWAPSTAFILPDAYQPRIGTM